MSLLKASAAPAQGRGRVGSVPVFYSFSLSWELQMLGSKEQSSYCGAPESLPALKRPSVGVAPPTFSGLSEGTLGPVHPSQAQAALALHAGGGLAMLAELEPSPVLGPHSLAMDMLVKVWGFPCYTWASQSRKNWGPCSSCSLGPLPSNFTPISPLLKTF